MALFLSTISALFLTGFDFSRHSIPLDQIESGGPPKDGIPALLTPRFIPVPKTSFLKDEDRVLGIVLDGEARAYPIKVLNWHEVVNDTVKGRSVVITYCPLCGTGMAFDAVINGKKVTFGVSGLLYNSDVLMYDHQTESLWSQIKEEAVTGPMTGTKLTAIPLIHTTWDDWRANHTDSAVLSPRTGYLRDYDRDPYAGYGSSAQIMFSVTKRSPKHHPKEWVLGVEVRGAFKAYPFSELKKGPVSFPDTVNGETFLVHFDASSQTAFITDLLPPSSLSSPPNGGRGKGEGALRPSVTGFWFAWYAFHPDTLIYHSPQ